MTTPIAIIGAGPSGLVLGRLLQIAGIEYTIFDRDESPTSNIGQGGMLDIHTDSGQLALRGAGLIEEFEKVARYEQTTAIADMMGKVHASWSATGADDRPEIDRKDLRAILLASIPAARVQWGCKIQSAHRDADGSISIDLMNGHKLKGYRLIVGADGAWSKLRSLITCARPQYSGITYFTMTITADSPYHQSAAEIIGRGTYMAMGGGKNLGGQLLGDGSLYLSIGVELPETWRAEHHSIVNDSLALREMLIEQHFSSWPSQLTDLIKHSDGRCYMWPLHAMPTEVLSWQTVPGLTLVGDAAHVSTPFQGEGVNCAMHDSLQLAQKIIEHSLEGLDQAVSEYEKMMFPRAISLIERSEAFGKVMFAQGAPQTMLAHFSGGDDA